MQTWKILFLHKKKKKLAEDKSHSNVSIFSKAIQIHFGFFKNHTAGKFGLPIHATHDNCALFELDLALFHDK